MQALIQKSDNKILRVASEGAELSEVKPFYWTDCPDETTLEWTFDGTQFNAPVVQPETPEQTVKRLEAALDRHLDSIAKSMGYLDIPNLVSYDGDEVEKWDKEAKAFKKLRSAMWTKAIRVQAEVQNGEREVPTEEELIELMPKIDDFLQ